MTVFAQPLHQKNMSPFYTTLLYELRHVKTGFLPVRKQRRRSASQ